MIIRLYDEIVQRIELGAALILPIIRLILGTIFIESGVGKLSHLADTTQFFAELHIPFPYVNAIVSSSNEIICGGLLLIGLFTRLAALPIIIIMGVAITTAQWSAVHSIGDLIRLQEMDYIVMAMVLLIFGPGAASVDRLLRGFRRK